MAQPGLGFAKRGAGDVVTWLDWSYVLVGWRERERVGREVGRRWWGGRAES